MSKWVSETLGLESKEQLKSHRKDKWRGILFQNNLDIEMYPWWTEEEKALEHTLWAEADIGYEEKKANLKRQLNKLNDEERETYFTEIEVENQDTDGWLAPSPIE